MDWNFIECDDAKPEGFENPELVIVIQHNPLLRLSANFYDGSVENKGPTCQDGTGKTAFSPILSAHVQLYTLRAHNWLRLC